MNKSDWIWILLDSATFDEFDELWKCWRIPKEQANNFYDSLPEVIICYIIRSVCAHDIITAVYNV